MQQFHRIAMNIPGLETKKLALMMVLMALTVFPLGLSAQRMTADQIFYVVNQKQQKIDNIRQGMDDAWDYFDLDNAEVNARQTYDYQAYMDFIGARYKRVLSQLNFAAAEIAAEIATFLRAHASDGVLDAEVINQGIAKYTDMHGFFSEYGNKYNGDFWRRWRSFSSKYGNEGARYFVDDNAFMRRYGVYVSE